MHNRKKEFIGLAILIFIGLAIALILAELGARLLPVPTELREAEKMLQCDRLVGWRGKPNLTSSVDLNNYQHNVTRNSWGMHDKEYGLAACRREIPLYIGDTFCLCSTYSRHSFRIFD